MIRNNPGMSSYFQGAYANYGLYQWNVKTYLPEDESEYESVRLWCLGEHVKIGSKTSNGNTIYGYEMISEVVGRPVTSHLDGRSAGWLVVDTELTSEELTKVDEYVSEFMAGIKQFLIDERGYLETLTFEENVELGGLSEGE